MGKREEATDDVAELVALRRSVSSKESVEATEGILLVPLIVRGTLKPPKPSMRSLYSRSRMRSFHLGNLIASLCSRFPVLLARQRRALHQGQSRAFMPWTSSVARKHYRCTSISDSPRHTSYKSRRGQLLPY